MNEIKIFNSAEFGQVRTATVNEEPMFCLADVCKSLGVSNTTDVSKRLDDDERTRLNLGRQGSAWFITESGLYAVILRSDKPNAKKFRKWVTGDVLPQIRKTGSYQKPMTTDEKIQLLAQGNTELDQKIENVKNDLEDFKQNLPLLGIECQKITRAKNSRVVPLLGGKNSNAYKDKSLRGKVYSDIQREICRQFGVESYKEIKRCQVDKAISIIKAYELPMALSDQVNDCNLQMNL